MDMSGEYVISASRQKVWDALNDPEVLKQCVPGCESIDKISDTEFEAKVTAKVGPVKAKFGGSIQLSDMNPPVSYKISGSGKGGALGFASGGADVSLAEISANQTRLNYTAKADVKGKMAQLGSRLVMGAAKSTADNFFSKFSEIVGEPEAIKAAPVVAAAGIATVATAAPTPAQPAPVPAQPAMPQRPVEAATTSSPIQAQRNSVNQTSPNQRFQSQSEPVDVRPVAGGIRPGVMQEDAARTTQRTTTSGEQGQPSRRGFGPMTILLILILAALAVHGFDSSIIPGLLEQAGLMEAAETAPDAAADDAGSGS